MCFVLMVLFLSQTYALNMNRAACVYRSVVGSRSKGAGCSFSASGIGKSPLPLYCTESVSDLGADELKGFDSFVRKNPKTDKIDVLKFHHVEFSCGDATTTYKRYVLGLGMKLISKSDLSTGNSLHASYTIRSGECTMMFTAPYGKSTSIDSSGKIAGSKVTSDVGVRGDVDEDEQKSNGGREEFIDTSDFTQKMLVTPSNMKMLGLDGTDDLKLKNGLASVEKASGLPIVDTPLLDAALSKLSHPFPDFDISDFDRFFKKHGLGVKVIAIEVEDVRKAYDTLLDESMKFNEKEGGKSKSKSIQRVSVTEPTTVVEQGGSRGYVKYAEIMLYGDVVLRLVSSEKTFNGKFWPNFQDVKEKESALPESIAPRGDYGIYRFDHVVGNLYDLTATRRRIASITGFHDFAEFTAADVGTVDSGLNSVVLASNNEMVLLPLNEPTYGTKRKSQIQTYLELNNGEGVQHMALFTKDIFYTLERMRSVQTLGGFEFVPNQGKDYYERLKVRLGDSLTPEQYSKCEELGILADKDDQGVLLQIFTKPVGDKPTLFLEIIQRVGCNVGEDGNQKPGCGGFGKGNFRDLFKSIEDYEQSLSI